MAAISPTRDITDAREVSQIIKHRLNIVSASSESYCDKVRVTSDTNDERWHLKYVMARAITKDIVRYKPPNLILDLMLRGTSL